MSGLTERDDCRCFAYSASECACGHYRERDRYAEGHAAGAAAVRESVEAVLASLRMGESRYHTVRAIEADLRAALATPTGGDE